MKIKLLEDRKYFVSIKLTEDEAFGLSSFLCELSSKRIAKTLRRMDDFSDDVTMDAALRVVRSLQTDI